MSQTVGEIGEVQLLERIMRITGRGPEDMPVPNGDDAAVLPARTLLAGDYAVMTRRGGRTPGYADAADTMGEYRTGGVYVRAVHKGPH